MRVPTVKSPSSANFIAALGDSLTYNNSLGVPPNLFYPAMLAKGMNALGCNVKARNFGHSGDSTCMALARIALTTSWEIPQLVVIYLGTNDLNSTCVGTVQASPAPTTTSCSVTAGVGQYLPVGTWITINGQSTRVLTQVADALTFTAVASIPVSGQTVQADTQSNLVAIVNWFKAAGVPQIVLLGQHYFNFSSGNYDTVSTPNAVNAALRVLQEAAATATSVPYVDLYAWMSALITGGTDTQGSNSWHVYAGNLHLNAYGQNILANAILSTIKAQTGWVGALS
jgi:lysophospholipase L1-like esterase